jgi:TatD DNase family protein
MKFIDTHSHIYLSQFDEDRDESIKRAIDNNVQKLILPNIDSATINSLKKAVEEYPDICYPLMGLHPTNVKENYRDELDIVFNELNTNKFAGVGEIGIDLYWDKTFLKEQKLAFEEQVRFAIKMQLPIVIHARDSFNEIMEVLDSINEKKYYGIFHAFSGNVEDANRVIQMGFKLGIGGVVTFKNAKLAELIKQIDISHIVLETDAPYLAPTPYRGKRNESSYIPLIAKKIAEIKEISLQEVSEITTENACSIFKL